MAVTRCAIAALVSGLVPMFLGKPFLTGIWGKQAVPGIGKVKARRTMEEVGLDEDVTLGAVPADQRAAIAERFAAIVSAS